MDESTWLELALAFPSQGETAAAGRRRERLRKEQLFPARNPKAAWDTWAHYGRVFGECLPLWFATGLVDVDDAIKRECPPADLSPERATGALSDKLNDLFGEWQAHFVFQKVPLGKPATGQALRYRLELQTTLVPPTSEHLDTELLMQILVEQAFTDMTNVGIIYRACGYCGRIFRGERSTATYCSTSCRTLALRKRKRETTK